MHRQVRLYLADLQGKQRTGPTRHQDYSVAMGQGRSQQRHKGKQGQLVRAHDGQHTQRLTKPEHRASQPCYLRDRG